MTVYVAMLSTYDDGIELVGVAKSFAGAVELFDDENVTEDKFESMEYDTGDNNDTRYWIESVNLYA